MIRCLLRSVARQAGRLAGLPLALVGFCCLSLALGDARSEPVRGLWVVRHDLATPEGVQDVLATAQRAGLTTLFVQVRGRGDAYYQSASVPRAEEIEDAFDPLGAILEGASERGMDVHAWFNVFLTWHAQRFPKSEHHVLNVHPEWFAGSRDGVHMGSRRPELGLRARGVEGRYLSPTHPAVHDHLLDVISELLHAYPVQGLHLDYIRYPNEHYDFAAHSIETFKNAYRHNPLGTDKAAKSSWMAWRSDRVTQFVRRVKRLSRQIRPEIEVSAAVKPDLLVAYRRYGQDWVRWLNRHYVDFVVPMFYVGTNEQIVEMMATVRRYVVKGQILAGVGAWNQSPEDTMMQAATSKDIDLDGFVIFSYRTLVNQSELVDALADRYGGDDG